MDITKLKIDEIEGSNEKESIKGYQIQKGVHGMKIIEVGEFSEIHDVSITTFSHRKYKCNLISCIIDDDMIRQNRLDVFKIIVNDDNSIIGKLFLSFKPDTEVKINHDLSGRLPVRFFSEKGTINLGELSTYPDKNAIVPMFVKYILDDDFNTFIDSLSSDKKI